LHHIQHSGGFRHINSHRMEAKGRGQDPAAEGRSLHGSPGQQKQKWSRAEEQQTTSNNNNQRSSPDSSGCLGAV